LLAQEFIAAQYPPLGGGGVSDAIRMKRALVSGALGMHTDDPKFFDATVKLPDCVIVLQSTRKKARTPVSAPPPNSIDSEVDGNDSCEVLLSQSTTDVDVYIELPEGSIDTTNLERMSTGDRLAVSDVTQAVAPYNPGIIKVSAGPTREVLADTKSANVTSNVNQVADSVIGDGIGVEPSNKIIAESQRILQEIDGSKLLQEELIRRDPSLASVSSFLSTVCGAVSKDKNVKKKGERKNQESDVRSGIMPTAIQTRRRYVVRKSSI